MSMEEKLAIYEKIKNRFDGGRFWLPEGDNLFNGKQCGERLRDLREKRKISQARMAKEIGISQQAYQKIESGKRKTVKKVEILAFAGILGCTASYLAGYSNEVNKIKGDTTLPVMISTDGEVIAILSIMQAYERDPELTRLCIEMLQGSLEQRKYYTQSVRKILHTKP